MKKSFNYRSELLKEIFQNLKKHKLRTFLTAFGISWGIFILVVLLGISGGVQEGVFTLFKGFTSKTLWFYAGETNKNAELRESGNKIIFKQSDIEAIHNLLPNIKAITLELQQNSRVIHNSESRYFPVKASNSNTFKVKNLKVEKGRIINSRDVKEYRRVAVIGDRIAKHFFRNQGVNGEILTINGFDFEIIGVLDNSSFLTMNEQNSVYIPISTFSETIGDVENISAFGVTISKGKPAYYAEKIKNYLARQYFFNSDNQKALYVVNYEEQMSAFSKFFKGFNIFLLFVGCCLLLSGVIGVSNIMYIIVKERTQEIGIKKAIGASSVLVLKEFILESLILTLLSGIVGILLGIGTLKIIDLIISSMLGDEQIITKTTLDMGYIILSFVVLSFAGLIAGFFPAQNAAKINPVTAINRL